MGSDRSALYRSASLESEMPSPVSPPLAATSACASSTPAGPGAAGATLGLVAFVEARAFTSDAAATPTAPDTAGWTSHASGTSKSTRFRRCRDVTALARRAHSAGATTSSARPAGLAPVESLVSSRFVGAEPGTPEGALAEMSAVTICRIHPEYHCLTQQPGQGRKHWKQRQQSEKHQPL